NAARSVIAPKPERAAKPAKPAKAAGPAAAQTSAKAAKQPKTAKPKRKRTKRDYCVYVIDLDPKVWRLRKKIRDANPRYKSMEGKGCLYVGMTMYTPEKRFLTHMDGGRNAAN